MKEPNPSEPLKNLWRRWAVAGILLLGLLLRLLAWYWDPILKPDAIEYLKQAQHWAECGILVYDQPPLFIFLLKSLYLAGLDPVFWGVLLNVFFGMAFVWAVWKAAEVLFPGRPEALCIPFLAAIHPTLILLSVQILRDMPYLAVMGVWLWRFLVLYQKDGTKPQPEFAEALLLGALTAVACFFRHEAFAGLIFLILYQVVAVCFRRLRNAALLRIPVMLAAFLAVFLLLGTFTGFYANAKAIYAAQYKESLQ